MKIKGIYKRIAVFLTSVFAFSFAGCDMVDNTADFLEKQLCNHEWSSGIVIKMATCQEIGEKKYYCSGCGATKTEKIGKMPHDETIIDSIPATCLNSGKTQGCYCSMCGLVFVEPEVLPITDCSWVMTAEIPATCVSFGFSSKVYCYYCNTVKQESVQIPMKEHINENGDTQCDLCGLVIFN